MTSLTQILVSIAALLIIIGIVFLATGNIQFHCDKVAGKKDECYFKWVKKK